jgi:hypothetical protein
MEVLTVLTQDEKDWWAYESRMKALRDESSLLREVREAKDRGIRIGQVHFCQELLKLPQTPEPELMAMPPEDLADLLAQLRKQALPDAG